MCIRDSPCGAANLEQFILFGNVEIQRDPGKTAPHLATSFWFALGDPVGSRAQIHRHLRHYMNWIPAEYVDAMAPGTGFAGTEDELARVLGEFAAIGTSEIHLIPTSSDLDQLRRVADVVADFDTGPETRTTP